MVVKGDNVVLIVRPPATMTRVPARAGYKTLRCDDAPLAPGRYDCALNAGAPSMVRVEEYLPIPQSAEMWQWYLCPPNR